MAFQRCKLLHNNGFQRILDIRVRPGSGSSKRDPNRAATLTTTTKSSSLSTFISSSSSNNNKARVRWLDLRGSGLSVLERLVLEECLWRHDKDHWVICGSHTPTPHRFLTRSFIPQTATPPKTTANSNSRADPEHDIASSFGHRSSNTTDARNDHSLSSSWNIDSTHANDSAAIVLGISGKPELLLNLDLIRVDNVQALRRFSGGGTVVLDHDSLWTTVIGRRQKQDDTVNQQPHEGQQQQQQLRELPLMVEAKDFGPKSVMQYTVDSIYGPMFQRLVAMQQLNQQDAGSNNNHSDKSFSQRKTMILDTKSCGAENTGRLVPLSRRTATSTAPSFVQQRPPKHEEVTAPAICASAFGLRENDFVWNERKVGGNAQSMGQSGWLQHTSFVWDYQTENMAYLSLPSKRPDYRGTRSHNDFLVKIRDIFPALTQTDVVAALAAACEDAYDLERVSVPQAIAILNEHGGMQHFFESKSRTKVLTNL